MHAALQLGSITCCAGQCALAGWACRSLPYECRGGMRVAAHD